MQKYVTCVQSYYYFYGSQYVLVWIILRQVKSGNEKYASDKISELIFYLN
jgi:hypothetical protein